VKVTARQDIGCDSLCHAINSSGHFSFLLMAQVFSYRMSFSMSTGLIAFIVWIHGKEEKKEKIDNEWISCCLENNFITMDIISLRSLESLVVFFGNFHSTFLSHSFFGFSISKLWEYRSCHIVILGIRQLFSFHFWKSSLLEKREK